MANPQPGALDMIEEPIWEVDTAALEHDRSLTERVISDKAKRLLAAGWEPFAVSETCMWFRLKST